MKNCELDLGQKKLDYLVKEAVEFIHENFDEELGYIPVAFSGGKDSIVLLDIVRRTEVPYKAHYVNTTIEPPEVLKFVREHYPEVAEIKAPPFFKMVRKRGFPMRIIRWCCQTQKKDPAPNLHMCCGLRAEESANRRKRGRITTGRYGSWNPIFLFAFDDVWDYIKGNGLPYPHLYDEGFDRLGCVVCPMISEKQLPRHMKQWPKHYAAMKSAFHDVWIRKSETLEMYQNLNWEVGYRRWLNGKSIFQNKKDDGQLELQLYLDNEDVL